MYAIGLVFLKLTKLLSMLKASPTHVFFPIRITATTTTTLRTQCHPVWCPCLSFPSWIRPYTYTALRPSWTSETRPRLHTPSFPTLRPHTRAGGCSVAPSLAAGSEHEARLDANRCSPLFQSPITLHTPIAHPHRMRSWWCPTGRRPTGICGAALYIAAKMHNFDRSVTDIIQA